CARVLYYRSSYFDYW
nr:immunoglobulin heavy chain junction region [Mus musculus]